MKFIFMVAAILIFASIAVIAAPKCKSSTFEVRWGGMLMGGCAKQY